MANDDRIPLVHLLAVLFLLLNAFSNLIAYIMAALGAIEYNPVVVFLIESLGNRFWLIEMIIATLASILFILMSKIYPICMKRIFMFMVVMITLVITYDSYSLVYFLSYG